MRLSRVFVGLVVIALIALGIIYLEDHGYFNNPRVDGLGLMKSDETTPKPEQAATPAPAPAPAPVVTPDMTNEAVTNSPADTDETPSRPANAQVQYVDSQGNPCRPVQAGAPPAEVHVYHHHRVVHEAVWTPPMGHYTSTACGMIQTTRTGERVVTLVPGMLINVAMDRDISNSTSRVGDEFTGYLVGPITYCGRVIVPAGATVQGHVVSSQRHMLMRQDDSILELQLAVLDANGFRVPLNALSYNRRMPGDAPYHTVGYMNEPNYLTTTRESGPDVTLARHSVVSFWLQTAAPVYF